MPTLSAVPTVRALAGGWLRLRAPLPPAGNTRTRMLIGLLISTEGFGVALAPEVVSRSQFPEFELLNWKSVNSHFVPTSGLLVVTWVTFNGGELTTRMLPEVVPETLGCPKVTS